MSVDEFTKLVEILRWPIVILAIFFSSRELIFGFISRFGHVEMSSSFAKIVLKNLEAGNKVSSTQVKKLRGLTGHDLWALDAFIKQTDDNYKYVTKFSPTRKAMVFSFVEMGLLEISGRGENRIVKPTNLASEVIEIANGLL